MNKILKTLTALTFSLALSATSYAAEFGVIDFNETTTDLNQKAPDAVLMDTEATKGYDYVLYIIPKETTVFGQKASATQFKFNGMGKDKRLYGYEFNLDDNSKENFEKTKQAITEKYGEPEDTKDLSTPGQDAILVKWTNNDKLIILSHYQYKTYRNTGVEIDSSQAH